MNTLVIRHPDAVILDRIGESNLRLARCRTITSRHYYGFNRKTLRYQINEARRCHGALRSLGGRRRLRNRQHPDRPIAGGQDTIVATNHLAGGSSTNATSYVTGSYTTTSGRLQIATIGGATGGASIVVPTVTSTHVTTWECPTGTTGQQFATPTATRRLLVFFGIASSSSASAVTITTGGETWTGASWVVSEFSGTVTTTNGRDAFNQIEMIPSDTNAAEHESYLQQFTSSANAVLQSVLNGLTASATVAAESGYTLLGAAAASTETPVVAQQFKLGNSDLNPKMSWLTSVSNLSVTVELRAATTPVHAITHKAMTSATSGAGTSKTTASITPPAGSRVFVYAETFQSAGTGAALSSVTASAGITFAQVAAVAPYGTGNDYGLHMWSGVSDGSATTVTMTASGNQSAWAWQIVAVEGLSASPILQSKTGTSASAPFTVTLDSNLGSVDNGLVSCLGSDGGVGYTSIPASGFVASNQDTTYVAAGRTVRTSSTSVTGFIRSNATAVTEKSQEFNSSQTGNFAAIVAEVEVLSAESYSGTGTGTTGATGVGSGTGAWSGSSISAVGTAGVETGTGSRSGVSVSSTGALITNAAASSKLGTGIAPAGMASTNSGVATGAVSGTGSAQAGVASTNSGVKSVVQTGVGHAGASTLVMGAGARSGVSVSITGILSTSVAAVPAPSVVTVIDFRLGPDIEAIAATKMRNASISGVNGVYSSIPKRPVYPLITVSRVGGEPPIRQYLDSGIIQVEVWGISKSQSHDIAQQARRELLRLEGTIVTDPVDAFVTAVDDARGLAWQPDPLTGRDRYVFSMAIYARSMG